MTRPSTSIYCIRSNQRRAIQSELDNLANQTQADELIGLIYAARDRNGDLIVGRAGIFNGDPDRATGALLRAALSLVLSNP